MEDQLKVKGINSAGFGIIPKLLTQDRSICIGAKGLYAYFCSYAGAGSTCFPTRKKICYDLGISNDTLGKYLKNLVRRGYIEVEQIKENGRFSHNVYTLCSTISPCPKISDTENTVSENFVSEKMDTKNNSSKINRPNISKKEREQKSSNFFAIGKSLNFEKDSSKAKAFEETKSQLQNLSLSQKSVAGNKPKAYSQENNSEMEALDLSVNDLSCRKTKASREKAVENLKSFDEIIDTYTQNEKLRFELKEHLKIRKQKKAALTNRALELSLQKLNSLASNDEDKLRIVQNSVMNGWTAFYPPRREDCARREEQEVMRSQSKSGNIFADMCKELKAEKEKENKYFDIDVSEQP